MLRSFRGTVVQQLTPTRLVNQGSQVQSLTSPVNRISRGPITIFKDKLLTRTYCNKLETRARGYKTFFMLSSAETKIYPAHKC